jgi:rifampicin phosphotransferase
MTMLDAPAHRLQELTTDLRAVRRGDLELVGGKAANLGELLFAGFPVPNGFVVSTDAYATGVKQADLPSTIIDAGGGDGSAIRAVFEHMQIPTVVAAAIAEAYADLGGGPVAVRSSATAEDLPQATFAGQQDTYLNVVGTRAVIDAVRRCWASLWSERALSYRQRSRVDSAQVRIAVVVQAMVQAEFAGVLFTANPVTGARDQIVIDANPGLGEAVVSGRVTPDHYVLDGRGRVREQTGGRREVVVRSVAEGGVMDESDVDADARLPESVITKLATLGRSVAEHFQRPQDIEWAYADGQVWLLQARPMTALPPPPLRLSRVERKIGLQLLDYLTVRPYPLDMSAWAKPGLGRMVQRMAAEIAGLRIDFARMLPERDGVVERFVPSAPRPTAALLTAPFRLMPRLRRCDPAAYAEDHRFEEFDQAARKLGVVDAKSLSWSDLFAHVRRSLAVADVITDLRVDYLPRTAASLLRLRVALARLGLRDLFGLLISGGRTRTEDANAALEDLASQVRADPSLTAAFTELDPPPLSARLEDDPHFRSFRAALDEFLGEYGHRETISPLVMATWSDDPAAVLGLVKVLVGERRRDQGPAPWDQAERRLLGHRRLDQRRRREAMLRLVAAARAGIVFREDSHFHATRVLPVLRRLLLEAGNRLAAVAALSSADEVFHLRLEELEAMPEPTQWPDAEIERVRGLARARADRRAELTGVPMLSTADLIPNAHTSTDVLVAGVPASGGQAFGPVRVIREPAEFGAVRTGDVLVCPYTNPAWTPLFARAAGVVVDSGGVGSHAAIVAREYGIPAVMGTLIGTRVLSTGQSVTVDGEAGVVTAGPTQD